jgi:hypothetical protein
MKRLKHKRLSDIMLHRKERTSIDSPGLTTQEFRNIIIIICLVLQDSISSIQKPIIKINRESTIREENEPEVSSKYKHSEVGPLSSQSNSNIL